MSADEPRESRSAGQPTSYRPSYCEAVIEWGREGKSRTWIASEIGVARETLRNWEMEHPEFLGAMNRARDLSQRWWEDNGQKNLETHGYQASMWSRSMAARFPDDWREKSENTTNLNATGAMAELLGKIASASNKVFPGDDHSGS